MGTPDFAVGILDAMCKAHYNVVAVVSTPDKAAGRGKKLRSCAVKAYAEAHEIPVLTPHRFKDKDFLATLASYHADIQVVVAFKMLPKQVWDIPPLGTFNLHASLLPQYRGAAPINHAIIKGERSTGVTTFFLDEQIDTGHVILQQDCPISPTDTAGSLHDKLMVLGADCVLQTLQKVLQNDITPMPQQQMIQQPLQAAPKIFKPDGKINWDQHVSKVYDFIRGLSPYPAAWTLISHADGQQMTLKIFETEIASTHEYGHAAPGSFHSDGKNYLFVFAANGQGLYIKTLQLQGKKAMEVKDFLRGFRMG